MGVAFALLALLWPFVEDGLVTQLGVRALALGFLALTALSLLAARGALPGDLSLGPLDTAAFVGLPLAAALTGEGVFLLLIPAWLYAALARIFASSLRAEQSLVERAAMRLEPNAPGFIGRYCRGVTALWAIVFLTNALGIEDLLALAIDLHDVVTADALRQILVDGPNADLLDALVFGRDPGGGSQRVVRLQLDHRPHDDTHRG